MEFKKLIFILSVFSINLFQCVDFSGRSGQFASESNSLASFGIGSSGSESVKDGEGSLPANSSGSFGPASYRSVSDVCDIKKRVEETENGRRNFDHFDANPDRCVLDPKRTEEAKAKLDSHYQEIIKECSVSHPEVKKYMDDLNRKTNQNIKNNLENAKIEARNIMAVLDGQEAPLKTYLKLAMAIAMQRGIKKILPGCDAKRKREIKNFYRISHLCKMIEQIFPDIMEYCKDYICTQTFDKNSNGHTSSVCCLTKLEEGIFASGSSNGIKIWKKQIDGTYICIQTLNFIEHVNCITKLEEGIFASALSAGIKIWEKQIDGTYICIQTLDRIVFRNTNVSCVAKLEEGIFASDSDNIIKIWQKQIDGTYICVQTLDRIANSNDPIIFCIAKLEEGIFASGSDCIKIWQKQIDGTYICIQTLDLILNGHIPSVESITKLEEGIFASASWGTTIKIWQKQIDGTYICNQTLEIDFNGEVYPVDRITKLGEGIFASGSADTTIKIWQKQIDGTYICIQTLDVNSNGHTAIVSPIAKLEEGVFVSGSFDETIKIWQLNSENQEKFIKQIIKVERGSLYKSEYSVVDAVDRPIWNKCVADNVIEIQPMQEEQLDFLKVIGRRIKVKRKSFYKSKYSTLDAVDKLIWNEYTPDNRKEIQPIQEEQFCNKNISDNTIGIQPIQEKKSWLSWAWKNKYEIALGITGAFAIYKIVQKLRKT